jgi:TonB-dependent SusC/RagA subfamily outer membrane receptor
MPRSSQEFSGSPLPALALLAGLLIGFVSGCAQKTPTSEAEPEVAPPEDSGTVIAGTSKVETQVAPRQDSVNVFAGTSQEVQKRPEESILTVLQGRTSGAIVSVSASGVISVRIRGAGSFYGGSEPLYVVDGVPFRPGPGGTLRGINPYDIESIRVLKGPPETTIYGVRGANGVVVITTRQPDR